MFKIKFYENDRPIAKLKGNKIKDFDNLIDDLKVKFDEGGD